MSRASAEISCPATASTSPSDAGKTWARVGFDNVDAISKIRIHPTNPDIVYVAAFGQYYGPSEERGVFKSTDGGKTWRRTLFRDPRTGAVDLAIDANNPNVIYAALWEAYRIEYQMSSGGPGSGLYKSTDGGETWTEITRNQGLPSGVVGRIGVALTKADSNRVYALVENAKGGLYVSDDAGATWRLMNESRTVRQRAFYYTHVHGDPGNKDVVYMLNTALFRSTDAGKTIAQIGQGTHGDHHDLWVDPDDSEHIIDGNDGGGAISFNASSAQRTWSDQDFPTAQWYHVVTTAHLPFHVCGSQQDNSSLCVPSNTNAGGGGFGGVPPPAPYQVGGGEPGYIAPDRTNPDVFFAGTNNGSFLTRYNQRTGELKEVGAYPRFFSGEPSKDVKERWQWTYPIIFSPVDPKILYTSSQRVWRTTNGGDTWEAISGDFSRHDPKTFEESGGPITHDMNSPEIYGTVFSLAPGKKDVNLLWAGSDDGLIHVTRDQGKTWTNVTPREMPDFGRVSQIDGSAFDNGIAYVAVKKMLLGDRAPYIFRTRDFGKSWTKIVNGIAANDYVHTVREDPGRRGLLYAGTQHGVYISFDDGETWQPFKNGLPDTPVTDLVVERNAIAIGTHGRSFYVMDDIAALRQRGARDRRRHSLRASRHHPWRRACGHHLLPQGPTQEPHDRVRRYEGSGDAGDQRPAAAEAWRETGGRRRGRRRWLWRWAAGRTHGGRRQSLHVGSQLDAGGVVPRHDPLGRDTERTDGPARHLRRQAHGGRCVADEVVCRVQTPAPPDQRCRSAVSVGPGEPHPRQGQRSQSRGDQHPPHQDRDRGADEGCAQGSAGRRRRVGSDAVRH